MITARQIKLSRTCDAKLGQSIGVKPVSNAVSMRRTWCVARVVLGAAVLDCDNPGSGVT